MGTASRTVYTLTCISAAGCVGAFPWIDPLSDLLGIPDVAGFVAICVAVLISVSLCAWIFLDGYKGQLVPILFRVILIGLVLGIVFLFAQQQGRFSHEVFWGFVAEPGTFASFAIFLLLFFIGATLRHTERGLLVTSLWFSGGFLSCLYILATAGVVPVPAHAFLSAPFILAAFWSALLLLPRAPLFVWVALICTLVVSFISLVLLQNAMLMFCAAIGAACIWYVLRIRFSRDEAVAAASFIVLCGLACFLELLSISIPFLVSRTPLDPHPSASLTMNVVLTSFGKDPLYTLIGTGPESFSNAWDYLKPVVVNATPLWDAEFYSGSGLLPTLLIQVGGVFVFAIVLGAAYLIGRSLISIAARPTSDALIAFLIFSFGFIWSLLYLPSLSFLFLVAIAGGYLVSYTSSGEYASHQNMFRVGIGAVVIGSIVLGFGAYKETNARALYDHAEALASEPKPDYGTIEHLLEASLADAPTPIAMQALTEMYVDHARAIGNSGSAQETQKQLARKADTMGREMLKIQPNNYLNQIAAGDATLLYAQLSDHNKLQSAIGRYKTAEGLAPTNPIPFTREAQAFLINGDVGNAAIQLRDALVLKPDYDVAQQLLAQLANQ